MEASSMVIKVKYGDMLRRFNAWIANDEITLNIDGLREKILSLFNFTPNTELMLTYIDEDGDEVTLVDNDDLCDVVKQALNPLRITVKLNAEKNVRHSSFSESSTPLRSPRVQQPWGYLNSGVSELLKTAPEPLRKTVLKHSTELASKLSSSAPGITEIVDYFSKLGLAYLSHSLESQPGIQSTIQGGVPESCMAATKTTHLELSKVDAAGVTLNGESDEQPVKCNESLEVLKSGSTLENNEAKFGNVTGVTVGASSSTEPVVNAVVLDSQSISVQTGNDSLHNSAPIRRKSRAVTVNVCKKEKSKKEKGKKIGECHSKEKSLLKSSHLPPLANKDQFPLGAANSFPSEKTVNKSSPILGSNLVNVCSPDPVKLDYVGSWNCPGSIWAPNPSTLNFQGSFSRPRPKYECPLSEIHVENISASPPPPASKADTFSKSGSLNADSFDIFHCGVRCDGCGVHPITGPRFKSKVKVDYDLCMICFAEMGNANDYIRMDRPMVYQHHIVYDSRARDQVPPTAQDCCGLKVKSFLPKFDSCFIQDVNIIDDTILAPLTPFIKIWRMKNNGTVMWPQKTLLVWIGGDKLSDAFSVELKIPATGYAIDRELDISVKFIAPELPGRYISYWRMALPSGQKFGQRIWVLIKVDASLKVSSGKSFWGLNLNLPPASSSLTGPEMIDVMRESTVEDSRPVPKYSKKAELIAPLWPSNEQELKFPINDSLLVASAASSSFPSSAAAVSFPVTDYSNMAAAFSSIPPAMFYPSSPLPFANNLESADKFLREKETELKLLKKLERDFEDADLNKEMLKMNESHLEQVVDDLCGLYDWDPLLEELKAMGFNDREMNKKLLKNNNGSLKRVVMALVAAEMHKL